MADKYDIYIFKTAGGEFRVRPATLIFDGNNDKLKIRNLTDYTAKLTFKPGFLDPVYHVGDTVSVGSGTTPEPRLLADDLKTDGYFEYVIVLDINGVMDSGTRRISAVGNCGSIGFRFSTVPGH